MNVIGNIFDSSGYSIHTRELANALSKHTDVTLITALVPNWEREVTDKELQMIKRKPDDINLIITNPLYWKTNITAKRNWVFLVWEGDKIPECYLEECLNPEIEYIFVPSTHTREALWNTYWGGIDPAHVSEDDEKFWSKVKIMSHGVDLDKFYPINSQQKINNMEGKDVDKSDNLAKPPLQTTFTFLVNKGWRNLEDRGGTQYAVQAYLEEFTKKDNIQLIIKVNPVYGVPDIDKMVKELGWTKDSPKIVIDTNNYKYQDLIKLYNQCDVFVCPTRAEAFGLPGLEAKACGKATIQTNYGGQTDYMKEGTDLFVDYELGEVMHELQYEGCLWAKPKIKELKEKMRWSYNNPQELKKRGKQALHEAREFTWDKTANLITNLI